LKQILGSDPKGQLPFEKFPKIILFFVEDHPKNLKNKIYDFVTTNK